MSSAAFLDAIVVIDSGPYQVLSQSLSSATENGAMIEVRGKNGRNIGGILFKLYR